MEASNDYPSVTRGEGWAACGLEDLGDGPGFLKVRRALDVKAFGVNVLVLPVGMDTGFHYHDSQEELYFVHRGTIEMAFGDGSTIALGEGGLARVDAATVRQIRNVGDQEAVYLCAGGKDGYVGRDGRVPEGEQESARAMHDLGGGSAEA
jgi:mannose-6-phosphate isomerase-like protein (cupin superfamily)